MLRKKRCSRWTPEWKWYTVAVSQDTYQELPNFPSLSAPQRTLCGPSRRFFASPGLGQCQIDLSHKKFTSNQQVFIVKWLRSNLLGLPVIKALNLTVRNDETTTTIWLH